MGTLHTWAPRVLSVALCLTGAAIVTPSQDSLADLRSRLAQLDGDLALEQQTLDQLESHTAERLAEMRAERRGLAEALLEARLEHDGAESERRVLEERWPAAGRRYRRSFAAMRAAEGAAQSAAKLLGIHFREIPGRDGERDRVLQLTDALEQRLERLPATTDAPEVADLAAIEMGSETWAELLELELTALRDGADISVAPARLRTAEGIEEDVSLLRIGNLRFAYCSGDRVGLALESPVDADGYRWSERLTPEIDAAYGAAIRAIESGNPAGPTVDLPMDPTGQIRPDSLVQVQTLEDRLRDGGPLMIPLGLVAAAAVLLSLERFWTLFLRNGRGARLARRVIAAAQDGDIEGALAHCRRSGGAVSRTLGACLERSHQGVQGMEDGIQEQLLNEVPSLERFIRSIAILAGVAPLLGLLGTVTGIIQTFGVIKALGTTDPALMAGGISVALVTTAAGLSVAIPVLLVQGVLRGRGARILSDAERYAASLLVVLAYGGVSDGSKTDDARHVEGSSVA